MNTTHNIITNEPATNEPGAFSFLQPERQEVPLVINSPHSGRYYPRSFIDASLLDDHSIRQSEDFLVDELFASSVASDIPMMCANYARAYLDVNREPYELDPEMFAGKLPIFANTGSIRVAGGLGTIARIVADGQEIYRDKLDVDEVISRIDNIYKPYHEALRKLLADTHQKFGYALLVDCHSMPSAPSARHGRRRNIRPDIVLGDRYGSSAAIEIIHGATQILRDLGYTVAINKPYAGGFITEHYGRPKDGLHAIQIEINRRIYMDEVAMVANENFGKVCEDMAEFVRQLILVCGDSLGIQHSLAAE